MARSLWAPAAEPLAAAARVVEAVAFGGQSADVPLAVTATQPGRAAMRAIALGSLRWFLRLMPALEKLLERPAGVPRLVRALLATAAHQVEYSRHAPQAVVDAAVDATRLLGTGGSAKLVNAVMRRFVAERAILLAGVDSDPASRTAHPEWLVGRIMAAWPERGLRLLEADNAHPPMTLRVDLSRATRSGYVSRLKESGIDAEEIQWIDSAVTLTRPIAIDRLPGFREGVVSIQDAGAQLAARWLAPKGSARVLDACAAPGGKTGHLLELAGADADLTAIDIDPERIGLIQENLTRLRRRAHVVAADVRTPEAFWDGRPFDRILVDAPCSSTGVIRRHPDIKLLRRTSDIPAFAATQLQILKAAVRILAPGGRLLYSTCSVLPEENEGTIAALLAAEPALRPLAMAELAQQVPGALEQASGVQLLPGGGAGTDGFYYACLEKTTVAS